MRAFLILACVVVCAAVTAQDNPYVAQGSIGKVEKKQDSGAGPGTLELDGWVGEKFILLPKPVSLREYGYQSFEPHLDYARWAGKILTVTRIDQGMYPRVHFKAEDGTEVVATAHSSTVSDIAPIRDLDYARARWLGKSLWLLTPGLVTYDEAADKFGGVELGRTAHVTVKNIVAGSFDHEPVRFILTADDGREGFLDVQLSGTNVSTTLRKADSFHSQFSETDPHAAHRDWSEKAWKAIAAGKIYIGMTAAQARMSWGEPSEINRTTVKGGQMEQWVYGENYVYVQNGVVTAIQH